MSIEDSVNFRVINERLTSSGVVSEADLAGLAEAGYEVVINLLPEGHPEALAREPTTVKDQGLEYVQIAVEFPAPTRENFREFEHTLRRLGGKKAHLHCALNFRVSAFYALFAERAGLWSREQADAFIADVWNPADHPNWAEFVAGVRDESP